MQDDFEEETPPPALETDAASISTELPVVVFSDDDATLISSEVPRVRLLQGRIHEGWVLYPIYALVLTAGATASSFALASHEWSAAVVALAWFLLYVWNWFYSVAYRYRRPVLKYSSVCVILTLTAALAYFSIERAQPQLAMVNVTGLSPREAVPSLYWAGIATAAAAVLLIAHLAFLGRGYRKKR